MKKPVNIKKIIIPNLPYLLFALLGTKCGQAVRLAPGLDFSQKVGGYIGAIVSVAVLLVILKAYGAEAFGSEMFPAAQAGAVAAMVGGISNVPAFVIGLVLAVILYCLNLPVMTLGLGVYLPFYLSATAFVGGLIRFIVDKAAPSFEQKGTGSIIAAGLLGGEASQVDTTIGGVSSLTQVAAEACLTKCYYWVDALIARLTKNRDYAYERLNSMPGVTCEKPEATFVIFPDISSFGMPAEALVKYLAEEYKVSLVPGGGFFFGPGSEGHVRICLATSFEILKEGLDRMEAGLKALKK